MKNKVATAIFLLILLGMTIVLSFIFKPEHESFNIETSTEAIQAVAKERDNSLDVLFFGDSECFAAYSPLQMYAEYGFSSYICGTAAQRPCDTFYIMEEVLKKQNPKVIVLETNCIFREAVDKDNNADAFFNMLADKFPIFKYHIRWKFIFRELYFKNYSSIDNYKGFILRTEIKPYESGEYMIPTDKKAGIGDDNMKYLENIINLCKEKDISLLLVASPSPLNQNYKKHNAIESISDKFGIEFIDYNLMTDELGIDWNYDTKDYGDHVNLNGAVKVTAAMGEYLVNNYNLPDHRNDKAYYEAWDLEAEEFLKKYNIEL